MTADRVKEAPSDTPNDNRIDKSSPTINSTSSPASRPIFSPGTLSLVLTVTVLILAALSSSISLRLFASRGLSRLSRPFGSLRSTQTDRSTESRLFSRTQDNMASVQKVAVDEKEYAKKMAPEIKLSAAEQAKWNSMAEHMDQFHSHFRYEFNRVYTLADGGFHKEGMSLARFLREAQSLAHHLNMHHSIERYIFPILAKKMPQFKAGARESGEHLKSHKAIHDGLERYERFLEEALRDTSTYNASTLRGIMDGFREVLYRHLDEEVRDLGGESLRAAGWTLTELSRIPM